MTENDDETPDHNDDAFWSTLLDEVAADPEDLPPGLTQHDLMIAAAFGFTPHQVQEVLASPELLGFVQRLWDEAAPSDALRQDSLNNGLLSDLLHATGYSDEAEELLANAKWYYLTDDREGALTKGPGEVSRISWSIFVADFAARTQVVRSGDGYDLSTLPQKGRGVWRLHACWSDGGRTSTRVTVDSGVPFVVSLVRAGASLVRFAFLAEPWQA